MFMGFRAGTTGDQAGEVGVVKIQRYLGKDTTLLLLCFVVSSCTLSLLLVGLFVHEPTRCVNLRIDACLLTGYQ
jgi:hypothetical protein